SPRISRRSLETHKSIGRAGSEPISRTRSGRIRLELDAEHRAVLRRHLVGLERLTRLHLLPVLDGLPELAVHPFRSRARLDLDNAVTQLDALESPHMIRGFL